MGLFGGKFMSLSHGFQSLPLLVCLIFMMMSCACYELVPLLSWCDACDGNSSCDATGNKAII